MSEVTQIHALILGLDEVTRKAVALALAAEQIVDRQYDVNELMEKPLDPIPALIFCGMPRDPDVSLIEIAQMLRMQYQDSPIYFLTSLRDGFDRKMFQK